MLETYFSASKMLGHLRSGPSGPYLDLFAAALERQCYGPETAVRYLRAAAHLGHVMAERGASLTDIDLAAFAKHLQTCRCPRAKGGRRNHHTIYGARLFHRHLVERGVCRPAAMAGAPAEPMLVADFKTWLRKHRGASDATVRQYARDAAGLMTELGSDPASWRPSDIRTYFLARASISGRGTIEKMTTNLRAFLRFLAVAGRCPAGLDNAVPAYAHWQLADMPRYLSAEQVSRLIAACDGDTNARRRDRAIVLLLARLGLRAGDVAQLRLTDIEWQMGSLRVTGKSRTEVRLPLPQDVGDAIAGYLECRPPGRSEAVFLRTIAPCRPFLRGDGISTVVRRAMKRAGIVSPYKGAHVLRHTAATEMLRHGVPLDKIGLVLRHRGIDTTAYYAKADVALLSQVAQPWPEAL